MIDDLRHFKSEDSFQLIPGDFAAFLLYLLGVLILVFWPYI